MSLVAHFNFFSGKIGEKCPLFFTFSSRGAESAVSKQMLFVASSNSLRRPNRVYKCHIVIGSLSNGKHASGKILQGCGPVMAVLLTVPSLQDFSEPLDSLCHQKPVVSMATHQLSRILVWPVCLCVIIAKAERQMTVSQRWVALSMQSFSCNAVDSMI
jgi:hypothetical protein